MKTMEANAGFVCILCGQDCASSFLMKLHVQSEHLGRQSCPICDISCSPSQELETHIYRDHAELFPPANTSTADRRRATRSDSDTTDLMDDIVTFTPDSALIRTLDFTTADAKVKVNKETQTYDVIAYDPPACIGAVPTVNDFMCPLCEQTCRSQSLLQRHVEDTHSLCTAIVSNESRMKTDDYHCNYVNLPEKTEKFNSKANSTSHPFDVKDVSVSNHNLLPSHINASFECHEHSNYNTANTITGGASGYGSNHIYGNIHETRSDPNPTHQKRESAVRTESTDFNSTVGFLDINTPLSTNKHQLFDCPFCGNKYDSLASVEVHIDRAHPDALASGKYSSRPSANQNCPMCGLTGTDVAAMTQHVNSHFDGSGPDCQIVSSGDLNTGCEKGENDDCKSATSPAGGAEGNSYEAHTYKTQGEYSLSRSMFRGDLSLGEYYHHKALLQQENTYGVDDGHSCTKGLMSRLREFYHYPPPTVAAVHLCSHVDHYASSIGDKGWGCGYRNMQMLLSCLATDDLYKDVLFNGRALIPSIPKIQRLIETAWQKGFDRQGARQLNSQLVNTTKWVGATDIMAAFQSLRVKCKLIDFHAPSSPDGTHPRLLQWAVDYFQHPTSAFLPPLLLQHQGHSRTIIGTETLADGKVLLLILDPGMSKSQVEKLKKKVTWETLKSMRRSVSALKAKQYQVLAVVGVIENSEYDHYKILKSERV